jgi:hypothetical protein
MYVCVCMCACMYVCMHVRIYVFMFACTYACVCVCMYVTASVVYWSELLATDPDARVRFPALQGKKK